MVSWFFRPVMAGGASGAAFRNTFEGSRLADALVRESIQNSVDAQHGREVTRASFELRDEVDVSSLLGSDYLYHAVAAGAVARTDRRVGRAPLPALIVEDFGTTGLTGSMLEYDSNMFKLMGFLGESEKEEGSGGSFGYGKAACILNSELKTVFAYTITRDGRSAFIGGAYFNKHEKYAGIGWYCLRAADGEPMEVRGEDADALARQIGIPRAITGRREPGTSLVILCPDVDPWDLKARVERYWWPRISDNELEVTIRDREILRADPSSRPELRHHLDLYSAVSGKRGDHKKAGQRVDSIVTASRRVAGKLGLMMLEAGNAPPSDSDDDGVTGSIALMRGPRMVVSYHTWSNGKMPKAECVGVFVADASVNEDLRMTESLKHDVWSKDASRATSGQRALAKETLNAIHGAYRRFAMAYEPPPPSDDQALAETRRFFGSLFDTKGRGGGGHEADPIEIIDQVAAIEAHGASLRLRASAKVRWKGKGTRRLRVEGAVRIAESDVSESGDPIGARMTCGGQSTSGCPPVAFIDSDQKTHVVVEVLSDPYDSEWTAVITFGVTGADDED